MICTDGNNEGSVCEVKCDQDWLPENILQMEISCNCREKCDWEQAFIGHDTEWRSTKGLKCKKSNCKRPIGEKLRFFCFQIQVYLGSYEDREMLWAPEMGDENLYECFRDNDLSKVLVYNMESKNNLQEFDFFRF